MLCLKILFRSRLYGVFLQIQVMNFILFTIC